MALPTYYNTGTASVANGATTITFTGALLGTAEAPNFKAGDLFLDPVQPLVPPQRIASVDYDAGEAELWVNWPGTSMTSDPYEVRFVDDIARSTAQTRKVLEQLGLGALLPEGGTTGQALKKLSDDDFDMAWADEEGGAIADVWIPAHAAAPASLDFHEDTDNGANRVRVTVPSALGADYSFVLPAANVTLDSFIVALLNSTSAAAAQAAIGVREVLTANRTYYVRADGSDSNTGLANTSGGAFLTIQKAINVATALDLSIYAVTIQLGAGTYSGAVTLASYVGAGPITIVGDETTPSNVIISRTGNCISGTGVLGQWRIRGMRLQTSGSGHAMLLTSCDVTFQNVDFGACAGGHIVATNASRVTATGNYSISGGASRHWWCEGKSLFIMATRTVTITGTPAFSAVFALAHMLSLIQCNAMTFVGSATGVRYDASTNGVILVSGAGATYLPGNSAGSAASGGQYV